MDDFFKEGRNRKTASQIIAEAKASIGGNPTASSQSSGNSGQQRVLTTKRPFTPRCTERSARPISAASHRHLIIVEEPDDIAAAAASTGNFKLSPLLDSNSKKADLLQRYQHSDSRLPALVPPIGSAGNSRQQFRPSTASLGRRQESNGGHQLRRSKSSLEDPLADLINQLHRSQDDVTTAAVLDRLCDSSLRPELMVHRRELMSILSRHLSSDNIRLLFPLAELLLLLTRDQGTRSLLILASKIIFKLSRDDTNDNLFLSRRTLDLLLNALGRQCPRRDHEAFIYAYGGLKFLSLNGKIATYLSDSLGFLHLCMLHTKILCDVEGQPESANVVAAATSQVLFQITSCLRNLCNLADNCEKFMTHLDGLKTILVLVRTFPRDIDVMCNVSRILSVLTASYEDIFDGASLNEDMIDALYVILSHHHDRRDVVVRVTFVLGNLAARSRPARIGIGLHSDTLSLLPLLLRRYLSDSLREGRDYVNTDEAALDFGSTGNSEDTAIKIIRVFANASIEPDTGALLADNDTIVNELLEAITMDNEHLMLPALATLNNLSYYPIANQVEVYNRLRGLLLSPDLSVAAEAARVIGNLSRRKEVRDCLYDDGFLQCTVHLLEIEDSTDLSTHRDLLSAFVGIIINLMSDGRLRPAFKSEDGISKCIDLLHSCLDDKDWDLACLVCQALWNYAIDCRKLSDVIEADHLTQLEDAIVYLLEAYNESTMQSEESPDDNGDDNEDLDGCQFCQVSMLLLKRILSESTRPVELLLNDE